ncbi:MAG: T9SS type A sorting domain-containing protein [Bacteroidales bacterium]|nr:T9SS type A sorting domain-containing protein [Bacteroidales bacterium]
MKKKLQTLLILMLSINLTAQNLLVNGGFETWTDSIPDGWTLIEKGVIVKDETSFLNTGKHSMSVEVITENQAITDIRQSVDITSGSSYELSVMIYHTDGKVKARMCYGSKYGPYSDNTLTGEWQLLTTNFIAESSGPAEIGLRFYDQSGFDGSEIVYIDDFKMSIPGTLSNDASLSELRVNGEILDGFDPDQINYTIGIPVDAGIPEITYLTSHSNATVKLANATGITGDEASRTTTIIVTAEDGQTEKIYSVLFVAENTRTNLIPDRYIEIYPVPAKDEVTIKGLHENSDLEIIDFRGIVVKRVHFSYGELHLNVSDLKPGIYLLKTINSVHRLIINR